MLTIDRLSFNHRITVLSIRYQQLYTHKLTAMKMSSYEQCLSLVDHCQATGLYDKNNDINNNKLICHEVCKLLFYLKKEFNYT